MFGCPWCQTPTWCNCTQLSNTQCIIIWTTMFSISSIGLVDGKPLMTSLNHSIWMIYSDFVSKNWVFLWTWFPFLLVFIMLVTVSKKMYYPDCLLMKQDKMNPRCTMMFSWPFRGLVKGVFDEKTNQWRKTANSSSQVLPIKGYSSVNLDSFSPD